MKRLILFLLLLASVLSAHAATYTVTNNNNAGAGSLREAISLANANPGADTIDFDTAGVFSTSQTITLGGAQLAITGALTIDAPSASGKRVKIDANNGSRIFSVQLTGAGTVSLKHLSLRDGHTTDDGGGIQVASPAGSTLELVDCQVYYCDARDGGGIDMQVSELVLTNSSVFGNDATRHGGGIITRGIVTMTGSEYYSNGAGSDGGGILADGASLSVSGGDIHDNFAQRGAGIFAKSSAVVSMVNGSVSLNVAQGDGGGIRAAASSTVTLRGVKFDQNRGEHGAGIDIRSSTLDATNCLIVQNHGGGIHFRAGTARVKNCTIKGNDGGTQSSGIAAETGGMSLGNTVVANNSGAGNLDLEGSYSSLGHNLVGHIQLATGLTNGVDGDIVGGQNGGATVDPRLDPNTYAPLARSRCLENGDSALVTSPIYGTAPFVDQAGNPRVRGVVDIGAIEGTFNAIITNDADSGAGSLRDALASLPTDISFDPAYFGSTLRTITLTTGQIALSSDITLVGPAPGVIISGSNASRIFSITGGAVTLRRIRIINGSSTGDGGGIRVINNGTSLALDDAGVSNSTAAGRGAGLYMQDNSTVSITNSTFANDAADGDGGAIHINGGTLNVTNSTLSNNSSKQGGGGLFSTTGTTTLINCTLAENTADSDNAGAVGNGGGLRRIGGTVNVGNTIVARNTDASSGVVHPDVSGVFVSLGHNFIGKTEGLDGSSGTPFQNGVNGDLAGTIASPLNPQLGALAQVPASSPTRIHPLLIASAARDAGDAALLTNPAWPSTPVAADQRGQFRTVGSVVDIGSVEYPDTNVVKIAVEDGSTSEHTLAAASFRIRRSYDDGTNQIVNVAVHASGTASATDYTLSGASYTVTGAGTFTVTIPAGKTSVLLYVTPTQDTIAEGVETVVLTISPGVGYVTDSGGTNLATILIYDDEYTVTSAASSGAGTLREAIDNANSGGGGVITMPANASVALNGTELNIASEIEIIGNNSTINAGGLSRVMLVENYGGSTVILRNLRLTGGYTDFDGGGLFVNSFTNLEMRGCTIIGNTAASDAGGIAVGTYALLTLTNCSVVDNTATGIGGGMWAAYGDLLFTNVTIAGNRAGSQGGGIYANNMTGTLTNCTITQNLAESGYSFGVGGGGGIYAGISSTFSLGNTVIAGNFDTPNNGGAGTIYPDIAGPGFFGGSQFNFIGSNAGNVFAAGQPTPGNNYVGTGASPLDPALTRVNGPTDIYYEFAVGSLLFDHGSNAIATTANDQRGLPRIHNGTVDIGAVEMDLFLVSNANASGAGSLRTALNDAAALGHGTVVFAPAYFSVPRTITLGAGGDLMIASPVIISAPADPAAQLTISGANVSRVFNIVPAAPSTVEFRNLDIINGGTIGYAVGNRYGACVAVGANASVVMTGCEIRNCDALTLGGGVNIAVGGSLTASDCTFASNHATTQGGAILNLGTLTLERVTLNDNTANAEGAAIANARLGTFTNCTFSNNRANNHGGAIYNVAGATDTLSLTHCTLTLNHANQDSVGGGNGGGIQRTSGIVALRNTIISGNDALASTQDDISGAFTSLGNNLIGTANGGTGFTNGVNGDLIGANAYLGPLQNNGGNTLTHAILAGSAAFNAASTIAGATDQRGLLRNVGPADIGAYELLTETYAYWAAHTFPSATNAGLNQDYDGDGFTNAFEFGAGSDALSAASKPGVTTIVSGNNFIVEFTASALAPLGYDTLRYSTDLLTWQNVASGLYQIVGANPAQNAVIYRVTVPQSFAPNLFFRLERLP